MSQKEKIETIKFPEIEKILLKHGYQFVAGNFLDDIPESIEFTNPYSDITIDVDVDTSDYEDGDVFDIQGEDSKNLNVTKITANIKNFSYIPEDVYYEDFECDGNIHLPVYSHLPEHKCDYKKSSFVLMEGFECLDRFIDIVCKYNKFILEYNAEIEKAVLKVESFKDVLGKFGFKKYFVNLYQHSSTMSIPNFGYEFIDEDSMLNNFNFYVEPYTFKLREWCYFHDVDNFYEIGPEELERMINEELVPNHYPDFEYLTDGKENTNEFTFTYDIHVLQCNSYGRISLYGIPLTDNELTHCSLDNEDIESYKVLREKWLNPTEEDINHYHWSVGGYYAKHKRLYDTKIKDGK